MMLLAIEQLDVTFPTESGDVHAVSDVSLTVASAEVVTVVGEPGAGKSVTALAVMGLLPSVARVSGRIYFDGVDLLSLPPAARGEAIGMIFQDPMSPLNPVCTIGWQLAEAVRRHDKGDRRAAAYRAVELLELVGVPHPSELVRSYPHELSGEMRQRVVIAMAIANDPRLLIADEPATALDLTVQAQILEMLLEIRREVDVAIVLITHDLGVVAGTADRVAVMCAGRLVETGPVDDVLHAPRMPYTAGLLAAMPTVSTDVGPLRHILGTPSPPASLPAGCPFAPRCPLVIERCRQVRPELAATDRPDHVAACHRWSELIDLPGSRGHG